VSATPGGSVARPVNRIGFLREFVAGATASVSETNNTKRLRARRKCHRPKGYDFYWQPPAPLYDPGKAKQLLAAAGFPKGFDAGNCYCDSSYANIGEAVVNNLLTMEFPGAPV
jgi:ABC-type transport system substrate-binding protein